MKLILWNTRNPTEECLIFIVSIFAFLSLACFSLVFCHKLVYCLLQNPFTTAALGQIETEVLLHQGWPEIDLFLQIILTEWAHSHTVLIILPSCGWGFCSSWSKYRDFTGMKAYCDSQRQSYRLCQRWRTRLVWIISYEYVLKFRSW